MSKDKKTPQVRFAGFTEDWEQRKVSELAEVTYGGGTPNTSNEEFWNGDIPWIQSSDITEHDIHNIYPKKYITSTGLSKSAAKLVPDNSIAIVTRVGVGKLVIMPFEYTTSQDFLSLGKLKTDLFFTGYLLYKKMQSELNAVQGTSIKGITKEELLNKDVFVPVFEEQKKIGQFFNELDTTITLHQRKCDTLQKFKKSMLQKMFPKNGESVPEIRFDGFTDAWEQREFGECCDLLTGNPFESDQFSESGILLIRGMNVKRNYLDTSKENCKYWHTSEGLEKYMLDENDILIQMDGALIGKSYAKMPKESLPAILVQRVTRARATDRRFDIDYLYQCIQRDFLNYIKGIKTETAVPHLSLNDIKAFTIFVPNIDEQNAIGSYFKNLDTLITLHQRKLETLKKLKKAMLQKMFV